jgi:hypothetical protein
MKARGRLIHYLRMHRPDAVVKIALQRPASLLQRVLSNVRVPKESKVNPHGLSSQQLHRHFAGDMYSTRRSGWWHQCLKIINRDNKGQQRSNIPNASCHGALPFAITYR